MHNDTIYPKVIINLANFMENILVHHFRDFSKICKHQIGVANHYTYPVFYARRPRAPVTSTKTKHHKFWVSTDQHP